MRTPTHRSAVVCVALSFLGCGTDPVSTTTTSTSSGVSSSAAGGGSSVGGATATSSASSGSPVEDCLDALDTDADGLVDCEDPDCAAGFACVDAPVSGWSGPWHVEVVPYPASTPPGPCPDGSPPDIYYAGPAPALCEACDCQLVGAVCDAPEITCTASGSCISAMVLVSQETTEACKAVGAGPSGGWTGCHLTKGAHLVTPGTCDTLGGGKIQPEPFAEELRVCVGAGAGCAPGKACAPRPAPSFTPQVCMSREGNFVCPVGWTSFDWDAYASGTDNRACSGCSCDASGVHCVGGEYLLFDAAGCNGAPQATITDSTCTNLNAVFPDPPVLTSYLPHLAAPQGEVCGESLPSGSVVTSGRRRVCCRD